VSLTREIIFHTSLLKHNIARGHGGAQRPPQGKYIYLSVSSSQVGICLPTFANFLTPSYLLYLFDINTHRQRQDRAWLIIWMPIVPDKNSGQNSIWKVKRSIFNFTSKMETSP
jgi:hypothetical protein